MLLLPPYELLISCKSFNLIATSTFTDHQIRTQSLITEGTDIFDHSCYC